MRAVRGAGRRCSSTILSMIFLPRWLDTRRPNPGSSAVTRPCVRPTRKVIRKSCICLSQRAARNDILTHGPGNFLERFEMHHLRYVGALLGSVLLLGAPAASAQADSAAATRLVTAMRIDDVTLLGLRLGLQRGIRDGKTSPKTLECVSKLDR